jgi:hypothetical protein
MVTAAVAKTKPATLGAVIDQLWAAREEKRKLEVQVKEIEHRISEIETQLMERMGAEGMDKATGKKASISITSSTVADVKDWDLLWPFIAKNKYWHLIQKRVSDPGIRELWESGKKVPGVLPFTKKRLNLRTVD